MEKMKQRELWAAIVAPLVMVLAPKLGVPEESLSDLFLALGGVASVYIGGRSYAKSKAGRGD